MNDFQDISFTTTADDINVTMNSINFYVPVLIPNAQTKKYCLMNPI